MQMKQSSSVQKDSQVSSAKRKRQVVADDDQAGADEEVKEDQEM